MKYLKVLSFVFFAFTYSHVSKVHAAPSQSSASPESAAAGGSQSFEQPTRSIVTSDVTRELQCWYTDEPWWVPQKPTGCAVQCTGFTCEGVVPAELCEYPIGFYANCVKIGGGIPATYQCTDPNGHTFTIESGPCG